MEYNMKRSFQVKHQFAIINDNWSIITIFPLLIQLTNTLMAIILEYNCVRNCHHNDNYFLSFHIL